MHNNILARVARAYGDAHLVRFCLTRTMSVRLAGLAMRLGACLEGERRAGCLNTSWQEVFNRLNTSPTLVFKHMFEHWLNVNPRDRDLCGSLVLSY